MVDASHSQSHGSPAAMMAAPPTAKRRPFYADPAVQVLAAMTVGVALGLAAPDTAIAAL